MAEKIQRPEQLKPNRKRKTEKIDNITKKYSKITTVTPPLETYTKELKSMRSRNKIISSIPYNKKKINNGNAELEPKQHTAKERNAKMEAEQTVKERSKNNEFELYLKSISGGEKNEKSNDKTEEKDGTVLEKATEERCDGAATEESHLKKDNLIKNNDDRAEEEDEQSLHDDVIENQMTAATEESCIKNNDDRAEEEDEQSLHDDVIENQMTAATEESCIKNNDDRAEEEDEQSLHDDVIENQMTAATEENHLKKDSPIICIKNNDKVEEKDGQSIDESSSSSSTIVNLYGCDAAIVENQMAAAAETAEIKNIAVSQFVRQNENLMKNFEQKINVFLLRLDEFFEQSRARNMQVAVVPTETTATSTLSMNWAAMLDIFERYQSTLRNFTENNSEEIAKISTRVNEIVTFPKSYEYKDIEEKFAQMWSNIQAIKASMNTMTEATETMMTDMLAIKQKDDFFHNHLSSFLGANFSQLTEMMERELEKKDENSMQEKLEERNALIQLITQQQEQIRDNSEQREHKINELFERYNTNLEELAKKGVDSFVRLENSEQQLNDFFDKCSTQIEELAKKQTESIAHLDQHEKSKILSESEQQLNELFDKCSTQISNLEELAKNGAQSIARLKELEDFTEKRSEANVHLEQQLNKLGSQIETLAKNGAEHDVVETIKNTIETLGREQEQKLNEFCSRQITNFEELAKTAARQHYESRSENTTNKNQTEESGGNDDDGGSEREKEDENNGNGRKGNQDQEPLEVDDSCVQQVIKEFSSRYQNHIETLIEADVEELKKILQGLYDAIDGDLEIKLQDVHSLMKDFMSRGLKKINEKPTQFSNEFIKVLKTRCHVDWAGDDIFKDIQKDMERKFVDYISQFYKDFESHYATDDAATNIAGEYISRYQVYALSWMEEKIAIFKEYLGNGVAEKKLQSFINICFKEIDDLTTKLFNEFREKIKLNYNKSWIYGNIFLEYLQTVQKNFQRAIQEAYLIMPNLVEEEKRKGLLNIIKWANEAAQKIVSNFDQTKERGIEIDIDEVSTNNKEEEDVNNLHEEMMRANAVSFKNKNSSKLWLVKKHGITTQNFAYYVNRLSYTESDKEQQLIISHPESMRYLNDNTAAGNLGDKRQALEKLTSDFSKTLKDNIEYSAIETSSSPDIPSKLNMLIYNIFFVDGFILREVSAICYKFRDFLKKEMVDQCVCDPSVRSKLFEATIAILYTACRNIFKTVARNNSVITQLSLNLEQKLAAMLRSPGAEDEFRLQVCRIMYSYLNGYLQLCARRVNVCLRTLRSKGLASKKMMAPAQVDSRPGSSRLFSLQVKYDFLMLEKLLGFQSRNISLLSDYAFKTIEFIIGALTVFLGDVRLPISNKDQTFKIPINKEDVVLTMEKDDNDIVHIKWKISVLSELRNLLNHYLEWLLTKNGDPEKLILVSRAADGVIVTCQRIMNAKEKISMTTNLLKDDQITENNSNIVKEALKDIDSYLTIHEAISVEKAKKGSILVGTTGEGTIPVATHAFVPKLYNFLNVTDFWGACMLFPAEGEGTNLEGWAKKYRDSRDVIENFSDFTEEYNAPMEGLLVPPDISLSHLNINTTINGYDIITRDGSSPSDLPKESSAAESLNGVMMPAEGVTISIPGKDKSRKALLLRNALKNHDYTRPVFDVECQANVHFESPRVVLLQHHWIYNSDEPSPVFATMWGLPSIKLLYFTLKEEDGDECSVINVNDSDINRAIGNIHFCSKEYGPFAGDTDSSKKYNAIALNCNRIPVSTSRTCRLFMEKKKNASSSS